MKFSFIWREEETDNIPVLVANQSGNDFGRVRLGEVGYVVDGHLFVFGTSKENLVVAVHAFAELDIVQTCRMCYGV